MFIILIPVLLLRESLLSLTHKLRILTFLCLNVFQIGICLGRSIGSGFRDREGRVKFGIVYTFLLIHVEASVAVIMSGVTAFRTVFAARLRARERERRSTRPRSSSFYQNIFSWLKGSREKATGPTSGNMKKDNRALLAGPPTGGTLRGLKTFIRRHEREPGHTTAESTMSESHYDPLQSYHEYMKENKRKKVAVPLDIITNNKTIKVGLSYSDRSEDKG